MTGSHHQVSLGCCIFLAHYFSRLSVSPELHGKLLRSVTLGIGLRGESKTPVLSEDRRVKTEISEDRRHVLDYEVMLRNLNRARGDPKVLAAETREQYFKLKHKLQLLTLGIGGVGLVSAYVSYSPEIAASFGAGLIGSLVYMRMLGTSIDSMADGAKGLIRGAIGQPRLLVPVALVMIYNRWNGILVPEYGFMHLDLISMLVGFFTYKVATFVQVIEETLTAVKEESKA